MILSLRSALRAGLLAIPSALGSGLLGRGMAISVLALVALAGVQAAVALQVGDSMVGDEVMEEDQLGEAGQAQPTTTQETCDMQGGENLGELETTLEHIGELNSTDCLWTSSPWAAEGPADVFLFELTSDSLVVIDMESTGSVWFNPFLVLNDSGGKRLQEDSIRGPGNNPRIGRNLVAGVYQVVAMSRFGRVDAGVSYRLSISRPDCTTESLGVLPRTVSEDALSRTGEFEQGCLVSTEWRRYSPGSIYTFELTGQRRVRIDLQGLDSADTYVTLYTDSDGGQASSDNDSGPGRDAAISHILDADTYRVEAGDVSNDETGERYRLTITVEAAESCDEVDLGLIHGTIVRLAEYAASGCVVSRPNGWLHYREGAVYLFELGESGRVSIDLEGSEGVDTYLSLSRADGQGRWWRDDNSGAARDARIDDELPAGRYRLEVSRNRDEQFGRYRLTIDASSQSVPTGRIVVRRLSDGRTEFGWLPADSTERILPDPRFLGANPSAGGWLNSGVVRVNGIDIGRINVRVSANGGLEFAFTPTDGERILPSSRRLGPNPRVGVWLRSSEISWADSDGE